MSPEIKIEEYSGPAELATAIRDAMGQLYVDDVWVIGGRSRHRVTATTVDAVCRGLLIAAELAAQREANTKVSHMAATPKHEK